MSDLVAAISPVAAGRTKSVVSPASAALGANVRSPFAGRAIRARAPVNYVGACDLPTPWAVFRLHGFVDSGSGSEHLALTLGDVSDGTPVLARVHSECLTGDALFSVRCDCGAQLEEALERIAAHGRGVVLYLRQEGRGIGLINKIRAYQLQDHGADTVEANEALGFAADMRRYDICRPMLDQLGVSVVRLMTNNPWKVEALEEAAIRVTERIAITVGQTSSNHRYLATKRTKLGHLLPSAEHQVG